MDKNIKIACFLIIFLVLITLVTKYYGSTDVHEYIASAKYFAGDYPADIRASHSMLYGFITSPLISLFNNFIGLKIASIIILILIIISVYYISEKNQKALLLISLSPIIWYIAPWISPIQLASLLFLWAFFFINKFEKTSKIYYLLYSGILFGFSASVWNSVIYFALFLIICFFYNKKLNHLLFLILAILIGFLPLFIFEQKLYGFFLYSMAKTFISNVIVFIYGSIYSGVVHNSTIFDYFSFLIMIPFLSFILFKKDNFIKYKKIIIFLIFSLFFMITNSQIRYLLIIYPIIILLLSETIDNKQFKKQIVIFLIVTLLVITPYLVQIKYSTNSPEFNSFINNLDKWIVYPYNIDDLIVNDLKQISSEYPNAVFLVGNTADYYAVLASDYFEGNIKEFVSLQDYEMYFKNESIFFSKRLESKPTIPERRIIWIEGGISKNLNDNTNYKNIVLGIGVDEPLNETGFSLVKKYNILYLSKKS